MREREREREKEIKRAVRFSIPLISYDDDDWWLWFDAYLYLNLYFYHTTKLQTMMMEEETKYHQCWTMIYDTYDEYVYVVCT
mmetsp:Transcript_4500/g.4517  ORF Transcript_4500/g.4517 Transcript_4500/m.4517 type:complete len:82 (+) Transcript_4500:2-247(+)